MRRTPTRLAALASLAALAALPGCLINSNNATAYTGNYVDNASLAQIAVRETTPPQAEAVLGPPTSKDTLDDGSEHWKWSYTKTTAGHGSLFLVLNANDTHRVEQTVNILFKDGVAIRKWRD